MLFSNKIIQAIYSILGNKLKQSAVMSEKYGIHGDESEADGRNSNQEWWREVRQINKVTVSHKLECDAEKKKSVNKDKTVILEQTQDITDNTQSEG